MTQTKPITRPEPRTPSDGTLEGLLLILCIVWIGGCLLIFVFCAFSLGPDWYRYWQLRRSGVVTPGQVVHHDLGDFWHAYIYQYRPQAAAQQMGQQSVRAGQFQPLFPGQPVDIRYLPGRPEVSVIEPYFQTPSKAPLLFVGLGVMALGGGLLLFFKRWQIWYDIYRLRNRGQLVPAKIINRWRTVDGENRSLYCVSYRFEATRPNGSSQTVVAAEYNRLAYELLRIGQHSPVRYLPHAPRRCQLDMKSLLKQQPLSVEPAPDVRSA